MYIGLNWPIGLNNCIYVITSWINIIIFKGFMNPVLLWQNWLLWVSYLNFPIYRLLPNIGIFFQILDICIGQNRKVENIGISKYENIRWMNFLREPISDIWTMEIKCQNCTYFAQMTWPQSAFSSFHTCTEHWSEWSHLKPKWSLCYGSQLA